jgi:hypothetical protein
MTPNNNLGPEFVARLANGGFAETMSEDQRAAIHIRTQLDGFLEECLDAGKQVVLTGNPGDGKTQYILMQQRRHDAPDDAYYLPDASAESDYEIVLNEWQTALENERPGILAINEGPLYEMLTRHQSEYEFLDTVADQLDTQIVLNEATTPQFDDNRLVVLNLNHRNVLSRPIALQAIQKLTTEVDIDPDEDDGHMGMNVAKLQNDTVQENFKRIFRMLGKLDTHVTIRDLLNFLAYCLTGGRTESELDPDEDLKYYNLAYSGRGTLFELFRQYVDPEDLTHPFVDSILWSKAEREVSPRDVDEARSEIRSRYVQLKRRFLFEDDGMDLGYSSKSLYYDVDYDFLQLRNDDSGTQEDLENLLRRINGYFSNSRKMTYELQLWFSQKYIGRSTKAILSRHSVSKSDFEIRRPQLNPSIEDAMEYIPDSAVLEYTAGKTPVRLEITRSLYDSFSQIDSGIPYVLRDREEEQVLLEFMRDVEYQETPGESTGVVTIKDAETGNTEEVHVQDDRYEVE